jgi:molybdenum cofactor biosynthesis protein B
MSGHRTPHDSARSARAVGFALLTVSDTRRGDDDVSGPTMSGLVSAAGHRVHKAAIVRDDQDDVREIVLAWALDPDCDVIVTSGGTGLSPRDQTIEAVSELFDIRIDGFGELFRHLSFQQIGPAAMLSRAEAGLVRGTPVFLLPGSPAAVTLGLEKLVLPEIRHLVDQARGRGASA